MAIQSFTCFHINFLMPMSGAAAYLLPRRHLLAIILTSLYTQVHFQVQFSGEPKVHLSVQLSASVVSINCTDRTLPLLIRDSLDIHPPQTMIDPDHGLG